MKIFLSWSGDTSHEVAVIFRDWLPSVIQSIQPYVSSEDINKGTRWSSDIAKELETSTYGIICITKENIASPWINFEAGALSKVVAKTYVCPFLFGVKRSEITSTSPLLQFQSTIYEKDDLKKLIQSINSTCGEGKLDTTRLDNAFEVWWPNLKSQLDGVQAKCSNEDIEDKKISDRDVNETILEEILELSRNQQKILTSPDDLLPQRYFFHMFKRLGYIPLDHGVWDDLKTCYGKTMELLDNESVGLDSGDTLDLLKSLIRPLGYLLRFQLDAIGMDGMSHDDFYLRREISPRKRAILMKKIDESEKIATS